MPPSTSEARTRRFNFQRAYQLFSKAGNNLKQSFTADLLHYTSNQAAKSAIGGAIGIEAFAKLPGPRRSTLREAVMGISRQRASRQRHEKRSAATNLDKVTVMRITTPT